MFADSVEVLYDSPVADGFHVLNVVALLNHSVLNASMCKQNSPRRLRLDLHAFDFHLARLLRTRATDHAGRSRIVWRKVDC